MLDYFSMDHSLNIEGKADLGTAKQMNICKKKIFKKSCYTKLSFF